MSGLKLLSKAEEAIVDRHLPREIAKGVARLLVANPDPTKWQYTGLQGVIALCEDTVGHCFWLKMVDVSVRDDYNFPDNDERLTSCFGTARWKWYCDLGP